MANAWTHEDFAALADPKNPRDGAAVAASGYTNLEQYLNSLGRERGE